MTGFETWQNGHDIDDDGTDSIKYEFMTSTEFKATVAPNDIRMLLNSEPYPDTAPDEEYDYTLAVVVGETLGDIQETADSVKATFEAGFPWVESEAVNEPPVNSDASLEIELADVVSTGQTEIRYSVPASSNLTLTVFDASGRRVEALTLGISNQGSVIWDTSTFPAGVYFVRLVADGQHVCERVIVVK